MIVASTVPRVDSPVIGGGDERKLNVSYRMQIVLIAAVNDWTVKPGDEEERLSDGGGDQQENEQRH